ncbi:15-hydroxyprostaglandin dehydrogenase [NAD(+)]-like [Pieris brassicae]|uniref:15-hydroxyprostaglandin dehydrogenase [NAD(+)]-like n=1 Tax=Pieris brassicae TaxID=7116 RepID=UPI001E662260|nr:15-hydroxyprostaglandin dehydrogenase [NAD(+)]-like [Pieris brassicae]
MHSLHDKVAVVTGGACGIGASVVKEFVKEGAKVTILDINEQSGKQIEDELSVKYGERVQFFLCDVTDEEQLMNAFDEVTARWGDLDLVVNNAGIADESFPMYKKQIALNFTTVITSTLRAMEVMRKDKEGKGGTIINVSSILGLMRVSPGPFVYGAIKNALVHFGSTIGMEAYYSRTNVRVITICFGLTQTSIIQNTKSFDEQINTDAEKILQDILVRSPGQTTDIAAKGVAESYKNGTSGSTWLVNNGVISDITSSVVKAYHVMSEHVIARR